MESGMVWDWTAATATITRDAATNNSNRTAVDWGLRLSRDLPPFYLIGSSLEMCTLAAVTVSIL